MLSTAGISDAIEHWRGRSNSAREADHDDMVEFHEEGISKLSTIDGVEYVLDAGGPSVASSPRAS